MADRNPPRHCRRCKSAPPVPGKYFCAPCRAPRDTEIKSKTTAYRKAADREWKQRNPAKHLYWIARNRAEKAGIPFSITAADLHVPATCPVLGIPMAVKCGDLQRCPSVDRVDNDKGYEPGNVRVISFRANSIKGDATVAELEAVLEYMRG